jgi:hypothetical protein
MQMKTPNKLWFFVEGDAEEELIKRLVRYQKPDQLKLFEDLKEFLCIDTNPYPHIPCYCDNCESVDNIGHKIKQRAYQIQLIKNLEIIVICDIEKEPCNSSRKKKILTIITELNQSKIKFIFFNPMIENFYFENEKIIIDVIKKAYKDKFQKEAPIIILEKDSSSKIYLIKQSFKKYNLKYKEADFAENFFPKFDYINSTNNTIIRMLSFINNN